MPKKEEDRRAWLRGCCGGSVGLAWKVDLKMGLRTWWCVYGWELGAISWVRKRIDQIERDRIDIWIMDNEVQAKKNCAAEIISL